MENSNFERFKAALELMRFKALVDVAGDTVPLPLAPLAVLDPFGHAVSHCPELTLYVSLFH